MPDPLKVQLRTYRRALGLTQEDLGRLAGVDTHSNVSRFERLVSEPDLRTAFACEIALGVAPSMLFAPIFETVKRLVASRAADRLNALTHLLNEAKHAERLSHLSRLARPERTLFEI